MKVTLDRYIETTPEIRGGKPCIAGRRITIADVAIAYLRLGQSLEEVAAEYDLTLAEVYAAMSFYYDNKMAIDESIQASEAFADEISRTYYLRSRSYGREALYSGDAGDGGNDCGVVGDGAFF